MTRVAIVAGSAAVRANLEAIVGASASSTVTAALASIDALLESPALAATDVILLHADGAEVTFRHLDVLPPIPVVVLTGRVLRAGALGPMLAAGVRGVLPHDVTTDEVAAAVEAAAAGLVVVPPELVAELASARSAPSEGTAFASRAPRGPPVPTLTPREREILAMLAEGLPNKLIASRLGISEHTVKTHVEAVFDKLGASTRAEAVAQGVRRGLLLL